MRCTKIEHYCIRCELKKMRYVYSRLPSTCNELTYIGITCPFSWIRNSNDTRSSFTRWDAISGLQFTTPIFSLQIDFSGVFGLCVMAQVALDARRCGADPQHLHLINSMQLRLQRHVHSVCQFAMPQFGTRPLEGPKVCL